VRAGMTILKLILYDAPIMPRLRWTDIQHPECTELGSVHYRWDKPRSVQRLFALDHSMCTLPMIITSSN
jgi:hypothetical protein